MARKSGDLQLTIGEKEEGDSLIQKEEKSSSKLETSEVPANPESDSQGKESSPDEPALEALREAYGNLTAKLHSPILFEHLLSSKLLTEVEYETAKSKETSYDKNTEVLSAMRRRTQKEIVQFCQLLFTCNQSNCGRILLAALTNHGVDVSSIVQPSPKPPVIRSSSPKYYPEMRDLNSRFITLVREVKGLGRQVEDMKTICIQLLSGVISTKRNVQEDISELKKCSDGDYIAHLQPYWEPLDCDLLYQLICQLQKPELMEDWERYKVEVKEACKAILADVRSSLPQQRELPAHQISAGFQTDHPSHDVTIQRILDLRDFLKKMMGLEEADFEGFDNVDVTLFYTVNRIRLPFLVRLLALHRKSLQEFSITVVFVPGEFIYNVTTDQEFAYPKLVSQAEPSYQMKDLKEEMLHQFQELKSSKFSEEKAISLKFKLKEEEILRKKVEEDRARLIGDLLKMQTEKEELVAENNHFAFKSKVLTEKLLSLQSSQSVMLKKELVMSSVLRKKMMSEVGTLLEQESSCLEGLQDKLKILLEEWSKQTEWERGPTEEEVLDLKDINKQLQLDLKSASSERDKFKGETERLEEDVYRTGKEWDRLQSRLENKQEDLKEKEEEIRHLKNDVEELAKQTTVGKEELDDKVTENESLKKELEEKKVEYDRVQGLYVAANKEKEARGQQIKERDEQLTEKQSDLESKQEHIDNLKRKMSAEEESYARLLNECYQLKETKQILENELKEAKQTLEDELKKAQQELTASLKSQEELGIIRRSYAMTYKYQCNRIQALTDAVDASKILNEAAEQFLAEEYDVHQTMKEDLIHAHQELCLARKRSQDHHKLMLDFVGKFRNLEHVNEELKEYKAEMERQQTVFRDLAAEKAVKELTESYRNLLDRHEKLEAEHKQCGQLAKKKRELQLKEEKLRKAKRRLQEKESVTEEYAKELQKEEGLVVSDDRKKLLEENAKLRAENQELTSLLNEFKRKESMRSHSPVVKASKEGWVKERSFLSIKLQRWSQAYFCVQRYPFFIHDFHLRELHSPIPSAQQYMLLPVVQSDVKPLDFGSVKDALGLKTDAGVTRLSISELITAVLEAAVQGLHLSLSATFYLFQRNITVCRFRIITASSVLVRDESIHHNPEEGGTIPRAFFVCSLVDVNEDIKPADITRSGKGTYYLTEVRGQGEQFAPFFRSKLRKEEGPIAVVTQHLDEILARHVDDQYRAFAKPLAMISEPHRL